MPWDIAYQLGDMGGIHVAQTRNDAIAYCCELLGQGAEIRSITNDDKKNRETLTIEQVQQYAAARSR